MASERQNKKEWITIRNVFPWKVTNYKKKDFNTNLVTLVDLISIKRKETIILGDIHCDSLAENSSSDTKDLIYYLSIYSDHQRLHKNSDCSSTLIDW